MEAHTIQAAPMPYRAPVERQTHLSLQSRGFTLLLDVCMWAWWKDEPLHADFALIIVTIMYTLVGRTQDPTQGSLLIGTSRHT